MVASVLSSPDSPILVIGEEGDQPRLADECPFVHLEPPPEYSPKKDSERTWGAGTGTDHSKYNIGDLFDKECSYINHEHRGHEGGKG